MLPAVISHYAQHIVNQSLVGEKEGLMIWKVLKVLDGDPLNELRIVYLYHGRAKIEEAHQFAAYQSKQKAYSVHT